MPQQQEVNTLRSGNGVKPGRALQFGLPQGRLQEELEECLSIGEFHNFQRNSFKVKGQNKIDLYDETVKLKILNYPNLHVIILLLRVEGLSTHLACDIYQDASVGIIRPGIRRKFLVEITFLILFVTRMTFQKTSLTTAKKLWSNFKLYNTLKLRVWLRQKLYTCI